MRDKGHAHHIGILSLVGEHLALVRQDLEAHRVLVVEMPRDILAELEVIVILSSVMVVYLHVLEIGVVKDTTQQHAIR